MKKSFVYLGFPLTVAVAACTGGGGGGGAAYSFTSGTYVASNAAILADTCGSGDTPDDYNGQVSDVVVTDSTIVVDGDLTLTRSGNSAVHTTSETIDLNPDADCILRVEQEILAVVTGTDQATVRTTADVSQVSGADCGALGVPLPCTQQVTFDLTKQ